MPQVVCRGRSHSQGLPPPPVYIFINFQTPAGGIDYSILEIPSSKKGISYRETDSQKPYC